jgi:flagellar biosynthesis/type III secretory pathway protein FliH
MPHQFREFVEYMNTKLMNSSLYYAQANGQVEASNKVLIKIIKKRIEDNPRRWHEKLSEVLWAHRTSRHATTKVTPFELVYGQEAVRPIEVSLQNLRVTGHAHLSAKEYNELMDKIEDTPES